MEKKEMVKKFEASQFVNDKKAEEYRCIICSKVPGTIYETECGHLGCLDCFQGWFSGNKFCFKCRESQTIDQVHIASYVQAQLAGMVLNCTNKGCSWYGYYGKNGIVYVNHLAQDCIMEEIPCPLCNTKINRHLMEQHQKESCLERKVTCDTCQDLVVMKELAKHKETKNELPCVAFQFCTNQCLITETKRPFYCPINKMEEHLKTCPESKVACEFCSMKIARNKMDEHVQTSMVMHLRVLTKQIQALEAKIQDKTTVNVQDKTEAKIEDKTAAYVYFEFTKYESVSFDQSKFFTVNKMRYQVKVITYIDDVEIFIHCNSPIWNPSNIKVLLKHHSKNSWVYERQLESDLKDQTDKEGYGWKKYGTISEFSRLGGCSDGNFTIAVGIPISFSIVSNPSWCSVREIQ